MSITFNSVPSNAAASSVFIEQEAVNRVSGSQILPRKILVIGQFNSGKSPTVNTPQLILSLSDAWTRYGRGSQLAAMIEKANPQGAVPVYALPLADNGSGVKAIGTVAFSGTATAVGTLALYIGGRKVTAAVAIGDAAAEVADAVAAAINADLDLPVTATASAGTLTNTVRWAGASGNQISHALNLDDDDELPAGITASVTDIGSATAGATDPEVATALASLGDIWYTDIAFPYLSSSELTNLKSAGDDRAAYNVNRRFWAMAGYTDTIANFITELDKHNSEHLTFVPVHGSYTPAYVIAAASVGAAAAVQQATPGRPLKNVTIPDVLSGSSNDHTYATRDTVVKAGGSHTYNTVGGGVIFGDLVTTRTQTDAGADTDSWRFAIIIPNLQFKAYALEQAFKSSPFDQAVLISDDDLPGPTYAIRPKTVKSYAVALVDDWVERGLSTSRDTIVDGVVATINGSNPGRCDVLIPDIPSAGLRILAVKHEWDFLV